jgi:hypothetical protein
MADAFQDDPIFFVFTLTRIALLGNSKGYHYSHFFRTADVVAPSHGIEIISTPAPILIPQATLSQKRTANGTKPMSSANLTTHLRRFKIRLRAWMR